MILAFGHESRVGKNTAQRIALGELAKMHLSPVPTSFAEPLKQFCAKVFAPHGLMGGDYYELVPGAREVVLPRLGKTPVQVWVDVGQAMRKVYPNVWVDLTMHAIDHALNDGMRSVVISDLRFVNEAQAIREVGGWCVKIVRPGQKKQGSDSEIPANFKWNAVIENTGTLQEFAEKVRQVTRQFVEEVFGATSR